MSPEHPAAMPSPTAEKGASRSDELTFRPCPGHAFGVEVELQILDRESADCAPGAPRLLRACQEEGIDGTAAELMQSMIEVKTGICQSVDEARDQLFARVRRLRNIASSLGYDLALGSTHPFHRATTSTIFPGERYEKILHRLQWVTYQRVLFGLHVHVAMPDAETAIGVNNYLVRYIPHLIALSASSPFWQGIDTGLASSRTALYRMLPHSGLPPHFSSWKAFRSYCRVMLDCQAISSFKDIYWDVRPRPDFGTIEIRVCDIPSSLTETLSLVAFIRSLVIHATQLIAERPSLRRGDIRRHWIAIENKWLATRHGLRAMYVRGPSGKRRPLVADVADLAEKLLPIARARGDESYLAAFRNMDRFETSADRQRRHFREHGDWKALVAHVRGDLERDLESSIGRTA
jgi:carboxylate-amine ligase